MLFKFVIMPSITSARNAISLSHSLSWLKVPFTNLRLYFEKTKHPVRVHSTEVIGEIATTVSQLPDISLAADRINVNPCIAFLKDRKIYKVKRRDMMPPLTFTSVINISSSSLFQVSFRSPSEKDGPRDYAGSTAPAVVPETPLLPSSRLRKIHADW